MDGFYWVLYRNHWLPAEKDEYGWWIVGWDEPFTESSFTRIGPEIIPPPAES